MSQVHPPATVEPLASQMARLEQAHAALERLAREGGAYPGTEGQWKRLDEGRAPGDAQLLYRSDGKDYKLIAHQTGGDACVQMRARKPELVDPVRTVFHPGPQPGPGWAVRDEREIDDAERFMQLRGEPVQFADPRLSRMMTGVCWAFGYWTPGAASW